MIHRLKCLQDEIHVLLKNKETYRDDDAKLICAFYYNRLGGSNLEQMSAMDFLHLLAGGNIPLPDNITRTRRKLQEKHPELRGKNYQRRKTDGDDMKRDIFEI